MILAAVLALATPANAEGQAAEVVAPIEGLFAGLAARDAARMLEQVRPDGQATVIAEKADGTRIVRTMRWADFVSGIKPGSERWEEGLDDPTIRIDGDMAMIWSPYVFRIDGRTDHCGINQFSLVREGGAWKILNVTWTDRRTGCPQ